MTHSTVIIATANAQTVETANKDQSDAILYQQSWNVTQPIKFETIVIENIIQHMCCITVYTLHCIF